ncbi:MAG: pyrroline-5-carboxylate reductase [Armatimonadota bacterium]|nr:pyrroline-5-carboxylate reductase [Armatimonadota bacterium]
MTDSASYRLGVIGTGVMGRALLNAAIRGGVVAASEVIASDISPGCRRQAEQMGCFATDDNHQVVVGTQNLLVAVKPQVIREVLTELREDFHQGQLLISIAAGVSLQTLREAAGPAPNLVRVMPNICCTVGEAACAWAPDDAATEEQLQFVEELLSAAGETVRVEERLLDAVTGLSGSGPAFVAVFIEALADGGVRAGLPREQAQRLAAQTALGAARWILDTDESPVALKDRVCSPGGTTIAGVAALESRAFRAAAIEAVVAAAERAKELGG